MGHERGWMSRQMAENCGGGEVVAPKSSSEVPRPPKPCHQETCSGPEECAAVCAGD